MKHTKEEKEEMLRQLIALADRAIEIMTEITKDLESKNKGKENVVDNR